MFLCKDVEVRNVGEKGRGVFATQEIAGGTLIGDYLGFIKKPTELTKKDAFYNMYYSDLADICPDPHTDGVHIINHSCEGNCATEIIGRHVILFAIRTIFPGEELGYDYCIGEQTDGRIGGVDNCHCRSPLCRGTMYSNPQQYGLLQEWERTIYNNQPPEPPVPYGEMLPPLELYPPAIADDPFNSLFGCRTQAPKVLDVATLPKLSDLRAMIRETGKQIEIPKLNLKVEGVLFNGTVLMESLGN